MAYLNDWLRIFVINIFEKIDSKSLFHQVIRSEIMEFSGTI